VAVTFDRLSAKPRSDGTRGFPGANPGLVDNKLEARLWSDWWTRNQATLRIVAPPTAALRVGGYD